MTEKQLSAMLWLKDYRNGGSKQWATSGDCLSTPGVMGSLVRLGYARSVTQSERPIHGPPISYGWYQVTEAGLAALLQS